MIDLNSITDGLSLEEDAALEKLRRKYAQVFLRAMRQELRRYNLSRHNVKILSGMGSACLTINDAVWPRDGSLDHNMAEVLCDLRRINAVLDTRWADYIDGESLTHYPRHMLSS